MCVLSRRNWPQGCTDGDGLALTVPVVDGVTEGDGVSLLVGDEDTLLLALNVTVGLLVGDAVAVELGVGLPMLNKTPLAVPMYTEPVEPMDTELNVCAPMLTFQPTVPAPPVNDTTLASVHPMYTVPSPPTAGVEAIEFRNVTAHT